LGIAVFLFCNIPKQQHVINESEISQQKLKATATKNQSNNSTIDKVYVYFENKIVQHMLLEKLQKCIFRQDKSYIIV
jgi:uncharacterized membrane protein